MKKSQELITRRNEYIDKVKALRYNLKNANAIMGCSDKVKGNIQIVQQQDVNKQNSKSKERS